MNYSGANNTNSTANNEQNLTTTTCQEIR